MRTVDLSQRELVVAAMFVSGFSAGQVGFHLGLTYMTVISYRKRVVKKYREAGYTGPADKISLGRLLNAEPRTWFLSGASLRKRSAA